MLSNNCNQQFDKSAYSHSHLLARQDWDKMGDILQIVSGLSYTHLNFIGVSS